MSARVQFEAELNEMKDELVAMCRLTADMIANATTALVNFDRELGRSIGESDKKVDEYEMDIEKRCMRILIRRQPVARDFRVVSTALKMITDIERFGDQASDIGDLVYTMPGDTYIKKATWRSGWCGKASIPSSATTNSWRMRSSRWMMPWTICSSRSRTTSLS